jgi:hypothetical protein
MFNIPNDKITYKGEGKYTLYSSEMSDDREIALIEGDYELASYYEDMMEDVRIMPEIGEKS